MYQKSVVYLLLCLGVCLLFPEGLAEIQQGRFRTKNMIDSSASSPVQEKTSLLNESGRGPVQEKTSLPNESGRDPRQSRDTGYLLSGGVSALGALLFIKVKAVLFIIAVILIIGLLTKVIGGVSLMCGMGGPCEGGLAAFPSAGHKKEYAHFHNYNVPAEDDHYRRALQTFDLGFLAKLMRSVDFVDLAFNVLNLEENECRKKFVCQTDNIASDNLVMSYIVESFKEHLQKYRSQQSLNSTEKRDCNLLYPECKQNLNPGLFNLLQY